VEAAYFARPRAGAGAPPVRADSPPAFLARPFAAGLALAEHTLNVLTTAPVEQGEVALYTGTVQWVGKLVADGQAQITANLLDAAGIPYTLYPSELDMQAVADWAQAATANGRLDVLVLYGDFPPPLYPEGNTMPDDSLPRDLKNEMVGELAIIPRSWTNWCISYGVTLL
jgi:hypothetical protein